jgi:hypothetical protein
MKVVKWAEKPGRYICIDEETGMILDDCKGWGFKTPEAALKSFSFKNRETEKPAIEARVRDFFEKNKILYNELVNYKTRLEAIGEKLSADDIRNYLQLKNIESPVEIRDLKEFLGKL